MSRHFRPAFVAICVFTLLTGVVYPIVITALAQWWFPFQANGSLLVVEGNPVGSALIGQPFSAPKYFWSRASATAPYPYNGGASSGSNQGPTSPALIDAVAARVSALRAADPNNARAVPVDLATASGSGLDPHISPASAEYQVERVARARGLPVELVRALVSEHTMARQAGILGEPTVNVLVLNLALDARAGAPRRTP